MALAQGADGTSGRRLDHGNPNAATTRSRASRIDRRNPLRISLTTPMSQPILGGKQAPGRDGRR